ncbi:Nicotinate phosphoribosyltransferase pncB2 [Candidatus Izimaplasma bacterium HR1]|jgi:nicotinate phosphoribosyltransferase|uniref:nicotinate phosphoribosyltransferase n=1 Tax=Candidatus Izimoplasma sp. HR1 TaxID=1541959 RepID=UPI0004F92878|nr:Nicotinate phosphoribosyltransferase pncB2 [Candidatus Izimaplasma bacterium HR1]
MYTINRAMLIDFYELTMANGYFEEGKHNEIVYFDVFYRSNPDKAGFSLFAGLYHIIEYIKDLHFTDKDIEFLRSKNTFSDGFLEILKTFKFTGDVYTFREGCVIFPNEPIMTIRATLLEAQLVETYLLQIINHQSLIATKAARIKYAAGEKMVIEMGARRAHGLTSSLEGTRAAYIAGIDSSSNVIGDQLYGIPSGGTMAHSWVQSFDTEYEAFRSYAETYPENTTLLVDTYNTLKSGLPNAIKVIKEVLIENPEANYAIRIDSGDLAYLSKKARIMLDEAGVEKCKIVVSNSLDEHLIKTLLNQKAPIDIFGVGERLITAKSDPVFGAVYKIVAKEEDGTIKPIIKISDNPAKITTPHYKKVYRVFSKEERPIADYIALYNEVIDTSKPLLLFDPIHTWKRKEVTEYTLKEMQVQIFKAGKLVYDIPTLEEVKSYAQENLKELWSELRRFSFPHKYYIDLSQKLWDVKNSMIEKYRNF